MNSKYHKKKKDTQKATKQTGHVKYKHKSTINENVGNKIKDKNEKIFIKKLINFYRAGRKEPL